MRTTFTRSFMLLSVGSLLAISVVAQAATGTKVLSTRGDDIDQAASATHIAWSANTPQRRGMYNAFVKAWGGNARQVNTPGTIGFAGSIDADVVTYQQIKDQSASDLYQYDINAQTRAKYPPKVNTNNWEYFPARQGDWLAFIRIGTSPKHPYTRIYLYSVTNDTMRLVYDQDTYRPFIDAVQIGGDYIVWQTCIATCDVYRYTISSRATTKIPNPAVFQYGPSVTADGTMYFYRSGQDCGKGVKLIRRAPGGPDTILNAFPKGDDGWSTSVFETGGVTDLYYSRGTCSGGTEHDDDIWKIAGANTASPIVASPDEELSTTDNEVASRSAAPLGVPEWVSGPS